MRTKIFTLLFALLAMAMGARAADGSYSVWLQSVGSQKMAVIKLINTELGIGLSNAQTLVNSAPCYLTEGKTLAEAQDLVNKLEELGATAEARVDINATNFPDANFLAWVKENCDPDGDGRLSKDEIQARTSLIIMSMGCKNLTGVEHFTAVSFIMCNGNQLTSLDLSKNTALTSLTCDHNQLTSLKLPNNTVLYDLNCNYNQLSSLDVSMITGLRTLSCRNNKLTTLDLSKNEVLTTLDCYNNQISETGMGKLVTSLRTVIGNAGNFRAVDLTAEDANVITVAQVNEAKEKNWNVSAWDGTTYVAYDGYAPGLPIDETNFPDATFRTWVKANCQTDGDDYLTDDEIAAVTEINVASMDITDLKGVEYFTALKVLLCQGNSLTALDVTKNTELTRLACGYNQLTTLDVTKNTKLENFHCGKNQLTSLNVTKNTKLWRFVCTSNQLTKLDVTKNTALTEFRCNENKLTALDMTKLTKLELLECNANQLASLDLSKNTKLTNLYCGANQLTKIDVTSNIKLTDFSCGSNKLTSLNVSKNTALVSLACDKNKLTSIDLSKNTKLTELYCASNQLPALDVKNNTALTKISCYYNQINEAAMNKFVESLPKVEASKDIFVIVEDSKEGNVMNTEQVAAAKAKGWYARYFPGTDPGPTDLWYYYSGSEPSGIEGVNHEVITDSRYYTLDGKRIDGRPTQKGIYIKNGRKVVVK